ncbi:hypothetical protein LY474_25550 [Myxococcus stipitatus]|uniref:SulP family inorganic anion transporter n=1 Tax=Myxococcus stipitatus TaxID=83455 RepID=UPI001EEC5283|nr:SulP family inorganic anion transporter [Myxococcus stipitatus]MCE9671180.1 hypothetical protein [Myxococcus stipitatus]
MSASRRRVRGFVPGARWVREDRWGFLRPDLLSALTLGAMLVPQGLAYAQIVGVRPAAGLYAGVVAMLAYAVFGPSRHLMLGPEAGAAIITASALASSASWPPTTSPWSSPRPMLRCAACCAGRG